MPTDTHKGKRWGYLIGASAGALGSLLAFSANGTAGVDPRIDPDHPILRMLLYDVIAGVLLGGVAGYLARRNPLAVISLAFLVGLMAGLMCINPAIIVVRE